MAKLIFVNLPVADLARATAFYQAVGAEKNEQFSDATASCMVFSETIHAMLLTHDKFRQFTPKNRCQDFKRGADLPLRRQPGGGGRHGRQGGGRRRRGRSVPEAGLRLHVWPQFRGSRRPHLGSDVDGCCRGDSSAARNGRCLISNSKRKELIDVQNLTVPVVRWRGRAGCKSLCVVAARFQDRNGPEEHRR